MWLPLPLKLMLSYLLVAALIAVPTFYPLSATLRGTLERAGQQDLVAQLHGIADELRLHPPAVLQDEVTRLGRILQARITVIDGAGWVTADSDVSSGSLTRVENHAARPEILGAREHGEGVHARLSSTTATELVYAAVPIDRDRPDGPIVRIATKRERIANTVSDAMLALRVGVGIGISAALVLSLLSVLSVSVPLRRLRDVARAFAVRNWVEVKRPRAGGELVELADALDELGRQLRGQLVAVGAAEGLALQAIDSLAIPAALLDEAFAPIAVNGALRKAADLSPGLEESVFNEVREELAALIAEGRELERTPIRALTRAGIASGAKFQVTALARPQSKPLWLVTLPSSEAPTQLHASVSALAEAEAQLPKTQQLAELHRAVTELVAAFGESLAPPTPIALETVLREAIGTDLVAQLPLPTEIPSVQIVDRRGLAVRSVRMLFHHAVVATTPDRSPALLVEHTGTSVCVRVEGVGPDPVPVARIARLLGAEAHAEHTRGKEAIWLTLRRA
ncbi:MAG: hypothetical protein SFX73_34720 [Kofleriaceae bacterium]|nr:hypothetical protein [Kofleriaceae bacterium]